MILEKKNSLKIKKKMSSYRKSKMLKAQMEGKLNKRLRKENKKKLLKEKRKIKEIEEKKRIKREKERERRKNKKILDNNDNDERILNSILDTIDNNPKYKKHFDFSYTQQKYDAKEIIFEVIRHIKYAIPWRVTTWKYSTLYSVYKKLLEMKIIKKTYIKLLEKYISTDTEKKLSIQSTDVTIVPNKCGSDLVQYNGHKKRKCTKSSQIHDSNGVVLGMKLDFGAKHDSKIFVDQLKESLLISKELNDQYKHYMLGDSGYDTSSVRTKIGDLGYNAIIYPNRRNNHNIIKLNDEEKEIYKIRIKSTEHSYSTEKTHRRINTRYDRNINSLYGAFYLSFIDLILKKQ